MHKKVALLIAKMVKESPYHQDFFTYELQENATDAFWGIVITFPTGRNDSASAALFMSLRHIGLAYGENLWIEDSADHKYVGVK